MSDIGEMEKEIIYQFTGNPFVDAGIWAICEWCQKERPEDLNKDNLRNIATDIVPLYLSGTWNSSVLHGTIFPNHGKISNPSLKKYTPEERNKKALDYFNTLIEEIEPLGDSGGCIACGRREVKKRITKSEIPLTGSTRLINYFSYGVEGADYCPACTFAVQFSPLIMYSCPRAGKVLLLLHSNSLKVMRYWARKAIHDIRRQILEKDYTGCFNENYTNPKNALFHIIQDIVLGYDERWSEENPSITLYHFTNYNQDPDLDLYYVPTQVFSFLAHMRQHEKYPQWMQIVRRGYVNVNWEKVKEEGDYRNKINVVFNNLLSGKSIVRFFIDPKEMLVYGDWDLLSYYLRVVRNMETKRLETLKRVGDELADYIKETESIKRLTQLEQASKYGTFRNVLRFIIRERVRRGAEEPLFSLEEYVEDLFPDGNMTWRETQDLLLFRIYETLHQWLVEQKKDVLGLIEEEFSPEAIALEE